MLSLKERKKGQQTIFRFVSRSRNICTRFARLAAECGCKEHKKRGSKSSLLHNDSVRLKFADCATSQRREKIQ